MKLRGRLNETNFETLGISRDNFLSIDILDHSKNICHTFKDENGNESSKESEDKASY